MATFGLTIYQTPFGNSFVNLPCYRYINQLNRFREIRVIKQMILNRKRYFS